MTTFDKMTFSDLTFDKMPFGDLTFCAVLGNLPNHYVIKSNHANLKLNYSFSFLKLNHSGFIIDSHRVSNRNLNRIVI